MDEQIKECSLGHILRHYTQQPYDAAMVDLVTGETIEERETSGLQWRAEKRGKDGRNWCL